MRLGRARPPVRYSSSGRACLAERVITSQRCVLHAQRSDWQVDDEEGSSSINLSEVFYRNAVQLTVLPVPKFALGMALWAAAELGLEMPEQVRREVTVLLTDQVRWKTFRAQDLGMTS
jgi:hypothetical protein